MFGQFFNFFKKNCPVSIPVPSKEIRNPKSRHFRLFQNPS
jgi:hypothetical protein